MTRPLYIFDLDGTLALIEHRRHFVENRANRWDEFYAACVDDKPNWPVIKTLKHLCQYGAETWIFSGRSDVVRAETLAWLTQHTRMSWEKTPDRPVFMRKHKDYTPDDVLKKQWLDAMLPKDRERLVAVFEDRDRMVRMWRDNGITCFQVAPGDF